MTETTSSHQRLQQQIECQPAIDPGEALRDWESRGWEEQPGTDVDEEPLKYLALVLLEAIKNKAVRVSLDMDAGVAVHSEESFRLPKAPTSYIARGLEILREIIGLEGPSGQATLTLGVGNDSLDLIVQKERGEHMITIPGITNL